MIPGKDEGKMQRMPDMFSIDRVNYVMYAAVIILLLFIAYYAVEQYKQIMDHPADVPADNLNVTIVKNSVESFSDGLHPVLVITAVSAYKSIIKIEIRSETYTTTVQTEEPKKNFTEFSILPDDTYGQMFDITATAENSQDNLLTEHKMVKIPDRPDVVFSVH